MERQHPRMTDDVRLNQIGGDHYKSLGIHVDEFAIANHWDADAFSCLKYLTRWFKKDGIEGLEKARTFAVRRQQLVSGPWPFVRGISAMTFCAANGLVGKTAIAIMALESVVFVNTAAQQQNLLAKIDDVIAEARAQATAESTNG